MNVAVNEEVASDRERLNAELGPAWETNYAPGSSGCHELLDRLSMLAEMVDRYLVEHPACIAKTEWHSIAESAAASLRELYQRVGADHLAADDPDA